jgi:hypothetical protein
MFGQINYCFDFVTMKQQSVFIYVLLAVVTGLVSCNSDEDAPNPPKPIDPPGPVVIDPVEGRFAFSYATRSLDGANIYLSNEDYTATRKVRTYIISNGAYTNKVGNYGRSFGDYNDAAYFIVVSLSIPIANDFSPGEFPQQTILHEGGSNASAIHMESGKDHHHLGCSTNDANEDLSAVIASGGFDDGEELILEFGGILDLQYFNGNSWVIEPIAGEFHLIGTVVDKRDL